MRLELDLIGFAPRRVHPGVDRRSPDEFGFDFVD